MKLIDDIKKLKRTKVKKLIDSRINEFESIGKKSSKEIFKELCFCILTANFNAERGIEIQKRVGNGFLTLSEDELSQVLKELGHRYPNTRARYIVEARRFANTIKEILNSFRSEKEVREWLVKNIRGLGYKEASHFLRNIGFKDLAIIDFHIIDLLVKYDLIERPKSLNKRKYLDIENLLRDIAKKSGMDLARLDLYLWYLETGKVLK